ncbi:hypothetical protein CL618_01525 [archaeon]|nr:hypothetical protein [archaeon]|tara:strand:- start:2057 stop:2389 length:333 start_codon:yes stop_codon:yes gene_type:complete
MKSKLVFGDEKTKLSFEKLKTSKTEDKKLYNWLTRAFEDLEENAFSGIQIPKKLIPKEYETKFGKLDNLWKYNLPNAWRLIYTIGKEEILILSIVLEWLDHKNYERRFKY